MGATQSLQGVWAAAWTLAELSSRSTFRFWESQCFCESGVKAGMDCEHGTTRQEDNVALASAEANAKFGEISSVHLVNSSDALRLGLGAVSAGIGNGIGAWTAENLSKICTLLEPMQEIL